MLAGRRVAPTTGLPLRGCRVRSLPDAGLQVLICRRDRLAVASTGRRSACIAVAAAALEADAGPRAPALALTAFLLWSLGVVLHLIVAGLVLIRLLLEVTPNDLRPPYWIAMGATAITVLAAARLDAPSTPIALATRPAPLGSAVMLWAFGTWLIPLLVVFSLWRHVVAHARFSYGPALWSVVFPLGTSSAASSALGAVAELPLVVSVRECSAWVAVGAWAEVFTAMLHHLVRQRPPAAAGQPTGDRIRSTVQ